MRQGRRGWFDTAFCCNFQSTFEGKLNLAGGLFTRLPVRHDAGPFNNLCDEAFVAFFGRIPNANFVIAGVGWHGCLCYGFRFRFGNSCRTSRI